MIKIKKGSRKNKVPRPVEKNLVTGYDSSFEYELHSTILNEWKFHPDKIKYVIEHTYEPDFIKEIDGITILLEAKGRFWDYAEFSKYIWIKKILKDTEELVFLFANPSAPMPQAKRRKDGTKRSHGEWATANGFRWFSKWSMPDDWINLTKREELDGN
tara:strand:+ start:1524 stop:1997 length:474 start_codon:yes stop_codon:yes gene_type:complete